jgi:hypothetical protein
MSTIERTAVRADLIDDDFDPSFGSRPEFSFLSQRERVIALLEQAGTRFGERGLGALCGLAFLAAEELRSSDDDSSFYRRLGAVGGEH